MVIKTEKGFSGTYVHKDEFGNIFGTSVANPFLSNELIHYDTQHHICGKSTPDFGGGYVHYNSQRTVVGKSVKSPFNGFVNYDSVGNIIGRTEESFDVYIHKNIVPIIYGV